jgi:hypothetical protein
LIAAQALRAAVSGAQWFKIKWTRTQRIRTAAELPILATIVDPCDRPVHLEIALKATHLR